MSDTALSLVTRREGATTAGDGEAIDDGHGSVLRGILGGGALGAAVNVLFRNGGHTSTRSRVSSY